MELFQAKVLTISSANHSTPQLPSSVAHFLLPLSTEDDIKFPKTQGCHVAMSSSSPFVVSPLGEIVSFEQETGEAFKVAWERILELVSCLT